MKSLLIRASGKILLTALIALICHNNLANAQNSKLESSLYLEPMGITDFTDKLNELGKIGYKLKLVKR